MFDIKNKFIKKLALVDTDGEKLTYDDLLVRGNYVKEKIKKNSVILNITSNKADCIIGYTAFLKKNLCQILLDHNFEISYINKIIKEYKPNYIFAPNNFNFGDKYVKKIISFKNYVLFEKSKINTLKINKINSLLLTTSGSTESPKFVRFSYNNIKNNVQSICENLSINAKHTTITTMPMAYSYGLSIINTHLFKNGTIILNDLTIFDKDFWEKINLHNVNSFGGVPLFYEYLDRLNLNKFTLNKIKYLTQAGGHLNKEIKKRLLFILKKRKIKFYIMYGQTEAGPRITTLNLSKNENKIDSVGKALKNINITIRLNKQDKIKKEGELIVKSKGVSLGYANSYKDLKKGDINKGKLFTGDLGFIDNNGFVHVTGRKKRISKIFGIRVDLDEIENFLVKNKIKCRINSDDKMLFIKNYSDFSEFKIEKIIQNKYKINKKFVKIIKQDKIIKTNFKDFKLK